MSDYYVEVLVKRDVEKEKKKRKLIILAMMIILLSVGVTISSPIK